MKRKRNKKLAEYYAKRPCDICGSRNFVSGHHIKSFGSGGECHPDNLISLCFEHHEEIHRRGISTFAYHYVRFRKYLEAHNWQFDSFSGKWIRLTEGHNDGAGD